MGLRRLCWCASGRIRCRFPKTAPGAGVPKQAGQPPGSSSRGCSWCILTAHYIGSGHDQSGWRGGAACAALCAWTKSQIISCIHSTVSLSFLFSSCSIVFSCCNFSNNSMVGTSVIRFAVNFITSWGYYIRIMGKMVLRTWKEMEENRKDGYHESI